MARTLSRLALLFSLLAVLLSAAGVRAAHAGTRTSSTGKAYSAAAALAAALSKPVPYRNLYLLTDQFKLRPPRPIARVLRTHAATLPIGHEDTFSVLSEDNNDYFRVTAHIAAETKHVYFYVQDGVQISQDKVNSTVQTFEHHIYPTDRKYFGSEWRPGVDGDPHIALLYADLRSSSDAGAFSAEDEYPKVVNPYSNQREMVYINAVAATPGNAQFYQFLAHEFQHMIHWHMHPHDNAWLNEGMPMLAEYLNGYPPTSEPQSFIQLPDTQLDNWSLTDVRWVAHYGAAYLFLSYVYHRFGRQFIREMLADSKYSDFALVTDVLRKEHINTTADAIFGDWVVANELRNASIKGGVYDYPQLLQPVRTQHTGTVPFSVSGSMPPYAAQYTSIDNLNGAKPFTLTLSAPSLVPATRMVGTGPFWWSSRGDMSDMRMERTFDLRKVHTATLTYDIAYDVEKSYDFGYIDASVDGGKTWTTLKGTHTTTKNPYGANYGNGYTGKSKGWVRETVNLARYAGHRVQLRFEYVTDDEYNREGVAVRSMAIPQIGYRDNGTGWRLHGFVRVTQNALPSVWHVALIGFTSGKPFVKWMKVSAGKGSLTVDPVAQGMTRAVVAVFSAAPVTDASSTYTLSAAPAS